MRPDDVDHIEAIAFEAWPAVETRDEDGWIVRYGNGFSRRLNSVTISSKAAIDDVPGRVQAAGTWLGARGVGTVIRVTTASPPSIDETLARRGFRTEGETVVMTSGLAGPDAVGAPGALVGGAEPSAAWLACQQDWLGITDVPAWRTVLSRVEAPVVFAETHDGASVASVGLGVVRRRWLGIFEVATDPERRRRGHATRLARAMIDWARMSGATSAYLQVVASNRPAIELYRGMGFTEAYHYWYRRLPADVGPDTTRAGLDRLS